MSRCHRVMPWVPIALTCVLGGCNNEIMSFVDIKKLSEPIVDVVRATLDNTTESARRFEYRVVVRDTCLWDAGRTTCDASWPLRMVHPSFEGRWTFSDPERPIDFYIINAVVWDDTTFHLDSRSPSSLPDSLVRWSSITGAVEGLGTLRAKEMHVHPAPGTWVVVLYNSRTGPDGKAEFSAEINLTYFR